MLPVFLAIAMALPDHLLNLVCRSGAVMDVEACCPGADVPPPAPGVGHALRDEACCSLRAVDLDRALSEGPAPSRGGTHQALATVALLPVGPAARPPVERPVSRRSMGQPPVGPPLRLLKNAFLL